MRFESSPPIEVMFIEVRGKIFLTQYPSLPTGGCMMLQMSYQ